MNEILNTSIGCQEVVVNNQKKKHTRSKVFDYLIWCLENRRHEHMLYFSNNDKTEFTLKFYNEKSPRWEKQNNSLFSDWDHYISTCRNKKGQLKATPKGRFASNIYKLNKSNYIMKIQEKKDPENKCIKYVTYKILKEHQVKIDPNVSEKKRNQIKNSFRKKRVSNNQGTSPEKINYSTKSHYLCLSGEPLKVLEKQINSVNVANPHYNTDNNMLTLIPNHNVQDNPKSFPVQNIEDHILNDEVVQIQENGVIQNIQGYPRHQPTLGIQGIIILTSGLSSAPNIQISTPRPCSTLQPIFQSEEIMAKISEYSVDKSLQIPKWSDVDKSLKIAEWSDVDKSLKIPEWSDVDKSLKIPEWSDVDKSLKIPEWSDVDKSLKIPEWSDVDKSLKIAEWSDVDKSLKIPESSDVDKSLKIPECSDVDKSLKIPESSDVDKLTELMEICDGNMKLPELNDSVLSILNDSMMLEGTDNEENDIRNLCTPPLSSAVDEEYSMSNFERTENEINGMKGLSNPLLSSTMVTEIDAEMSPMGDWSSEYQQISSFQN